MVTDFIIGTFVTTGGICFKADIRVASFPQGSNMLHLGLLSSSFIGTKI